MRSKLVTNTLGVLTLAAIAVGLFFAATSSPDAFQGDYVRIMYVHVPGAWLAFLAFGVTALGSAGWLISKRAWWDDLAESSAEIGVLFTAVALFTGSLWGEPVWGTYWDWGDARMASTALMFFVYLGYIALRRATPDPVARARRSAILGLIAVVQVPLVYFSVTFWRSLHQGFTVRPDDITLEGSMVAALLVNLLAFTLLYVLMMRIRMQISRSERTAQPADGEPAGAGITSPNLESLR